MQYLGNYTEDSSLTFKFHTTDATGQPITLAGTPAVAVYVEGSTAETTAGVALSVDYDSRTGLHSVTIDLSSDAFYAVNKDYQVVLTAGTVDGVNVFPAVLACFSIEKRFNEVDVTGWRGSTPGTLVDTDKIPVSVQHMATDSMSAAAMSTGAADKVADHVWDESSLAHVGVNSFGALIAAIKTQVDANGTAIAAVQNNTRVVRVVPQVIERPDSGTQEYRIELLLYDETGNMEAPDAAPTVDLVDQGGTDLTGRLDSTTMTLVSTGRYRSVYTASDDDDLEQLIWVFSVVEGSATRIYGNTTLIVDTTAVDFTNADRTLLQAAAKEATALAVKNKTDNLPASPAATGDIPTASAIADAVCDEALSGHTTAGTVGKAISDTLADTTSLNDTALPEITSESDIPAEPSLRQGIMMLYMLARNNTQATATLRKLLNNAGNTVVQATMSDNGTTFNQGKLANP